MGTTGDGWGIGLGGLVFWRAQLQDGHCFILISHVVVVSWVHLPIHCISF